MPEHIAIAAALVDKARRPESARLLAQHVGAHELVVLVRDPELGVMVPAPGMPGTVRGDSRWRELVGCCRREGRHASVVSLAHVGARPALAIAGHGAALIFIGGQPDPAALDRLDALLPLMGAMLGAEQRIAIASAQTTQFRLAAERDQALARALESARVEGARLYAELHEQHVRKDEFLAMLAHELRNPLAPIVSAVKVLKHPSLPDSLRGGQLDVIDRQAGQLTRLIEDLLDASRVSRGLIELRRRPLDLRDVLLQTIESMRPTQVTRGLHLDVDLPSEPLMMDGDPVRITQVFANLLHNAIKYTEPGGHIRVSAAPQGERAVVRIEDDGIGISAEMLPRIFDLFTQASVGLDRTQGGLGIGLTLVRLIVQLHGGEVIAQSAGLAQGSCFTVSFHRIAPLEMGYPTDRQVSQRP